MSYSLLSPNEEPAFNSGVVNPFQCLSRGASLVKDQYFVYVLMCMVILVIFICIPFSGLFWGAWISGIYAALFGRMRGEWTTFSNAISKGFGVAGPSFVVAILWNLPFVPLGIGIQLFSRWQDQIQRSYPGSKPVPSDVTTTEFAVLGGLLVFYVLAFLITALIFPFAYQLVVDRQMSGWKAVKLSARAARANFGGVLGLAIVELMLNALGFLLCCIGLAFVLPWTKSAWAVAYTEVFSLAPQNQTTPMPPPYPPPPPPPPAFGV
jgi:hypothetical protein